MQAVLDVLISPYQIRWVRECIHFVVVVGSVFICGILVLYHQAFYIEVSHYWQTWTQGAALQPQIIDELITSQPSLQGYQDIETMDVGAIPGLKSSAQEVYDYHLDSYLSSKLPTYTLAFNTTVPGNRVIIRSLGVDAPIVDVPYVSDTKLADADFDEDLKGGTVRYPFTALPGEIGNSLIFGHSSVDGWEQKDNAYGFVFYKLPKILPGEEIEIIREGKKYTYIVEEKVITKPGDVGKEIEKHTNDKFLTLMACYPLFTDSKRILVRARYKEETPQHLARVDGKEVVN